MDENEAYETLQELLSRAVVLSESGHYSADEIVEEVKTRLEVD